MRDSINKIISDYKREEDKAELSRDAQNKSFFGKVANFFTNPSVTSGRGDGYALEFLTDHLSALTKVEALDNDHLLDIIYTCLYNCTVESSTDIQVEPDQNSPGPSTPYDVEKNTLLEFTLSEKLHNTVIRGGARHHLSSS